MKQKLKWLLPVLIVTEVILFSLDVLSLNTAIIVAVIFELFIGLIALKQLISSASEYRRNRRKGLDSWTSFESSIQVFVPSLAAKLITSELKIFYYLGIWVFRRIKYSDNDYTYHCKSNLGLFVILILIITPAEIFILGILLPWVWLKWILGILSIYAFFWFAGVWASMLALPFRLTESGLTLHNGIFAKAFIPYSNIASISRKRTENLSWDGLTVDTEKMTVYSSNGGSTDVVISLCEPVTLHRWIAKNIYGTTIHVAVDEPAKFIVAIEERLG